MFGTIRFFDIYKHFFTFFRDLTTTNFFFPVIFNLYDLKQLSFLLTSRRKQNVLKVKQLTNESSNFESLN